MPLRRHAAEAEGFANNLGVLAKIFEPCLAARPIASRAHASSGTSRRLLQMTDRGATWRCFQTPSTIDVKVGSATCVPYPFVLYP